ncbi:unnamed protein product [Boreogadus saida]
MNAFVSVELGGNSVEHPGISQLKQLQYRAWPLSTGGLRKYAPILGAWEKQTLKAVKRKLPFGTLGEDEEEEKDGGGRGTRDVNFDSEVGRSLSEIMWHDAHTQERFDALHKKLPRDKQMRDHFVCPAQQEPSSDSSSSSPAPAGSSSSTPCAGSLKKRPSVAQRLARKDSLPPPLDTEPCTSAAAA